VVRPPTPLRRLGAWTAGLLVGWVATDARAHVPAAVELSATVDAEAVRLRLRVVDALFASWLGAAGHGTSGDGTAAPDPAVGERIDRWARVAIDRVPVRGVVERVERTTWSDHGLTRTYVVVTVAYGAKGMPREVAIAWTHFEGAPGWPFDELDVEVEGLGETSYGLLRPREPEMVWHRPRTPVAREAPVPPPAPGRRGVAVSLPALLLAALLVGGAVASLRVPSLRRPALGLAVAVAAAGLAALGVAPVRVPLPGSGAPERPEPAQAEVLFESLLRNVYRAFDHDREDAIYDTLAHSVSGPLLDRVYEEVYTSLVMKEQGGAVSKVQKVEVLDQEVTFAPDDGDPSFAVRARWRVHGKVGHWGHTHQRVNEHEAVYTVAPEGDRWKIVAVKVLAQSRVDTGPGG
jgi:hypothetical protein